MNRIVQAICPDFPKDRKVAETKDRVLWYKINFVTRTLFIPPENTLRVNMFELNKTIESVQSFVTADLNATQYRWDNLQSEDFYGDDCFDGIKKLNSLIKSGGFVSVDIEAHHAGWRYNKLLAIGFAYSETESIALYGIPESAYPALSALLTRKDVNYIYHNGKFDITRLDFMCGIKAKVDEDSMIQHYVQINEMKGTHKLKVLAPLYIQAPQWDDEMDKFKSDYCKAHKMLLGDFTYNLFPPTMLMKYLHFDVIATYRLHFLFKKLARVGSDFIYRKLIDASNEFAIVELNGFKVDLNYLECIEYQLEEILSIAERSFETVCDKYWDVPRYVADTGAKMALNTKFNPASPKQLKWLLELVLGTKMQSTDKDALDGLIKGCEEGEIKNPQAVEFITAISTVRKAKKQYDTYITGIRTTICDDERVRTTFNLHGTETGRPSAKKPNMLNIPRDKYIKNLFVADDGNILIQLDQSQAELRMLGILSKEPELLRIYKDGLDIHDQVATIMFGPNFTKEQRVMAKSVDFGIIFGRGAKAVAIECNVSVQFAKEFIDQWFANLPVAGAWIKAQRKMARKGESLIWDFGRERHFCINDENLYHIENEYVNTPIQGNASDVTMFGLLEIGKMLRANERYSAFKIIMTVYDSIVIEGPADDMELVGEVAMACKQLAEDVGNSLFPDSELPFKVDVETGYKWGEMHKYEH